MMQCSYLSSETSDRVLERALSEAIVAEDPETETPAELFLKNAVIEREVVSKNHLLECLDARRQMEFRPSIASVLTEKGYLNEEQLKELLNLYITTIPNEQEGGHIRDLQFAKTAVDSHLTTYAEIWTTLQEQERTHQKGSKQNLDEILVHRGMLTTLQASDIFNQLGKNAPSSLKGNNSERIFAVKALDERFIGKRIGPCEVLNKIGDGGMGAVYRARHIALNKIVAVKIMSPALVGEMHKQRFLREAQAAASLEHPNIVIVHDTGEEDGFPYIVMQLIKGKSVRELLKEKGKFTQEESLRIIEGAASGLGAAHEKSIIHRDVKPDNIMITTKGDVELTDFGLAKSIEKGDMTITTAGTVVGTPAYMPPEQFEAETLDARSDIYSLGATLYHMLAGRPPFTGDTAFQLRDKHLKSPLPPLDAFAGEVHPGLSHIIHKMLAKKREARYQSIAELITEIKRVSRALAGKAIDEDYILPSDDFGQIEEAAPALRKKKIASLIAILGAVAAIVIFLLLLFPATKPSPDNKQSVDTGKVDEKVVKRVLDEVANRREEQRAADRARLMKTIAQRLESIANSRTDEMAKEKGWDAAKVERVKSILRKYTEKIAELSKSVFDRDKPLPVDAFKKMHQIRKETRSLLLEIITGEEADELLVNMPVPPGSKFRPRREFHNKKGRQPPGRRPPPHKDGSDRRNGMDTPPGH